VEEARSLVGDTKAVKNETELKGMRACHIRDGAALIEYFAWLEQELPKREINEVEAVSISRGSDLIHFLASWRLLTSHI